MLGFHFTHMYHCLVRVVWCGVGMVWCGVCSPKLRSKADRIREEFVSGCLQHVRGAPVTGHGMPHTIAGPSSLRIDRAIGALKSFLDFYYAAKSAAPLVTVKMVVCIRNGESRWSLRMSETSTIGEMRRLAGNRHHQRPEMVLLRRRAGGRHNTSDEALDDDSKTLADLRITSGQQILVSRRDTALEQPQSNGDRLSRTLRIGYASPPHCGLEPRGKLDPTSVNYLDFQFSDTTPSGDWEEKLCTRKADMTLTVTRQGRQAVPMGYLATNKRYFDQLFDLLNYSPATSHKVWRILQLLPTNGDKLRALRGLGDAAGATNWGVLLGSHSTFTLLYSLQIVDAFLQVRKWALGLGGCGRACVCVCVCV